MTDLLAIKKKKRAKNPKFLRTDGHKKKRLAKVWRGAKGLHNKIRIGILGKNKVVKIGYGTPAKIRHIELSGLKKITVSNVKDLSKINPKSETALIANVGLRNKMEIIKEAIKKKIIIFNIKNPESFLKESEEKRKQQAEEKKKEELAKRDKEKEKIKTKEEVKKKEEKKEEELNPEEKEEQERREKEKLLIKKQ